MTLALAGKSNALIECLNFSINYIGKENILIVPALNDSREDSWQYSITGYCERKGLKICNIEDLYPLNDLIFISIQFDKLIDISKFKSKKLYNIHFSYLPFYKGMYPIIWPIINQEEFSGVTIHKLDWGIDTGAIVDQIKIYLTDNTTSRDLYFSCLDIAVKLFKNNLSKLINDELIIADQPINRGSYYSKKTFDFLNPKIDLDKTACEISAQFRALIFPEYQYPKFLDMEISKVEIIPERSYVKPGKVLENNDHYFLISSVDYNLRLYKSYSNQLFNAIETSNIDNILKLMDKVANELENKNKNGWTALMMAAFKNDYEMVRILVENGADVNAKDFKGMSVLMYAIKGAIKSKKIDALDYLIRKGANIDDYDNEGNSLISYAEIEGDNEILNYLKKLK